MTMFAVMYFMSPLLYVDATHSKLIIQEKNSEIVLVTSLAKTIGSEIVSNITSK